VSSQIESSPCWMFLVRHGATDYNLIKPNVLQGSGIDGPLAEVGREQASKTSEFLASFQFDAMFASPMKRAMETAEMIARPHHREIIPIPQIVEADVGRWLGKDWAEIESEDPENFRRHREDPAANPYPDGESATDVANRAFPVLAELLNRHAGQRILVVAHNIVNRVVIAKLHGIPLKEMRRIRQDNCCVNVIRGQANQAELVTSNSIFHLGSL